MQRISILLLLIFLTFGCASYQRTEVKVNNDIVYGTPKDVEIFQECETYVCDWLVDAGIMYHKNKKINIIFTDNVAGKTNIEVLPGESIIGLYKKSEDKIYCIRYRNILNLNKFRAKKNNIYRGVISHEIAHAYLYSLEYPYTISILQEFICANVEINLYSDKVKKRILKTAENIKPLTKDYFLNMENYRTNFIKYQTLSYYYWNIVFDKDIEKFKDFFGRNMWIK